MGPIERNIKKIRTLGGYKQDQFAEKLGVTVPMQKSYEGGKAKPDIVYMERLGKLCGIDQNEIWNREVSVDEVMDGFAKVAATHGEAPHVNGVTQEHATDLSRETLFNLTESNRMLAEANRSLADANKQLAANTIKLTATFADLTAGAAKETPSDVVATLQALQEYTTELAAQVRKQSAQAAVAELGIKMVQKKNPVGRKGIHADGDR